MGKRKISAVIVVEGRSDTIKVQQYYDVETFETSGTGLRPDMLEQLKKIAQTRQIIVFTDPDVPGEQIRRIVMEAIPSSKQAILKREDAQSKNKKKLGVEHARFEAIDEALNRVHSLEISEAQELPTFTQADMLTYGLIGFPDSKKKRDIIANKYVLGVVNAKTFLKRLNMFGIERPALEAVLSELNENERGEN